MFLLCLCSTLQRHSVDLDPGCPGAFVKPYIINCPKQYYTTAAVPILCALCPSIFQVRPATVNMYSLAILFKIVHFYSTLSCGMYPCVVLCSLLPCDRLIGLVVRRPPRERKVPGLNPTCDGIFSGSSHTIDLKIGIPVATLPVTWRYRVSAGTGWPGVSIL